MTKERNGKKKNDPVTRLAGWLLKNLFQDDNAYKKYIIYIQDATAFPLFLTSRRRVMRWLFFVFFFPDIPRTFHTNLSASCRNVLTWTNWWSVSYRCIRKVRPALIIRSFTLYDHESLSIVHDDCFIELFIDCRAEEFRRQPCFIIN